MLHIIRKPIITEKSNRVLGIHQHYVFEVDPTANKNQIKLAVEKMFQVNVEAVRTVRVKGKAKTRYTRKGVMQGRTKLRKKAYIRLQAGQSIDLAGGEGNIE
jgi:large subunit ribosomal protein L23